MLNLYSCSIKTSNSNNQVPVIDDYLFVEQPKIKVNPVKFETFNDLKPNFKFENLKEFNIENFEMSKFKPLDSIAFHRIFTDKTFDHSISSFTDDIFTFSWDMKHYDYELDYYYSWNNRDSNFYEFTVITNNLDSYELNLNYLIFNKEEELIDAFIVSSHGGDGLYTVSSSGKFIDRNTYQRWQVEIGDILITEDDEKIKLKKNEMLYGGDSTLFQYTIGKNGKVNKKVITKKHFTIKEKFDNE